MVSIVREKYESNSDVYVNPVFVFSDFYPNVPTLNSLDFLLDSFSGSDVVVMLNDYGKKPSFFENLVFYFRGLTGYDKPVNTDIVNSVLSHNRKLVYIPEIEVLTFENFKRLLSKNNGYNNPLLYLPFERKRIVDDFLRRESFDLISFVQFDY